MYVSPVRTLEDPDGNQQQDRLCVLAGLSLLKITKEFHFQWHLITD